jgi:hypothetical protein
VGGKVEQNTAGTVYTAPIVEHLAQYTPSTDWTKKEKLQWRYAYLEPLHKERELEWQRHL